MEALVGGHPRDDPRDARKVSVSAAGPLRERRNTEFVWELSKTGSCEGSRK